MLDRLLGEKANLELLREAFRAELERDPLGFWRQFVMPLLPREQRLDLIEQPDFTRATIYLPDNGRDGFRIVEDTEEDAAREALTRPPLPPPYRRIPKPEEEDE